jgi:asparagine synthase (glutamine-hydrolysing)
MCGIAGILDISLSPEALRQATGRMCDALAHRGPDGSSIWSEGGVALGHRRLAVIDLSPTGQQPMVAASGRFVITYNGEIYNFRELRKELSSLGAHFNGGNDAEVALAAIDHWGLKAALPRFTGMFAFALWDRHQRSIHLVRDRLGVKPLFWAHRGRRMVFSSETRALLSSGLLDDNLSEEGLAAYLRWGYVPAPNSIVCGIHKLPPGHLVTMTAQVDSAQPEAWWCLTRVVEEQVTRRVPRTEEDALRHLEEVMESSVRRRLVADVPVGAFLSGGTESAAVVALMQKSSNRTVQTFTLGFQGCRYDEAPTARRIAAALGTFHREIYAEPTEVRDLAPKLGAISDEPLADGSLLATYLIAKAAREDVTVVLTGDGGDELFAGYSRYFQAVSMWRVFRHLPMTVRIFLSNALGYLPSVVAGDDRATAVQQIIRKVRRLTDFLPAASLQDLYERQHTFWPSTQWPGTILSPELGKSNRAGALASCGVVELLQVFDSLTYLPDDVLVKVDRATMAVGLEAREPLLDQDVLAFAWQLPRHLLEKAGGGKWLLRRLLDKYLPPGYVLARKKGFGIPMAAWLRTVLRQWAEDVLEPGRIRRQGLLDPRPISVAWTRFLSGEDIYAERLWNVLMLQSWLQHRKEGRIIRSWRPPRVLG